jgi:salicylate hydroxylase
LRKIIISHLIEYDLENAFFFASRPRSKQQKLKQLSEAMGSLNDTNGITAESQTLDVAIVGGGIIGLVLALGLLKRGIHVKIYEQAHNFHEIGAGVAFTANAQRCMHLLDPRILEAMKRVANKNPNDYYQYVDGYNHSSTDPNDTHENLLFKIYAGKVGFDGCHRAHFLDELVKFLPKGVVEFGKRFDWYYSRADHQKVLLKFLDGSSAEADLREFIPRGIC